MFDAHLFVRKTVNPDRRYRPTTLRT